MERWFGLFSEKRLKRGVHKSLYRLEQDIREYLDIYNEDPKPFVWVKTADEILETIARFCRRTSNSGH